MKPKSTLRAFLLGYALLATSTAFALDGTWTVDAGGNWSDPANWSGGIDVANGADFTATFDNVITANRTVTLDSNRTIGNISAADTSHNYTISGANILTLDVTAGIPTINVPQNGRTLQITSVIAGSDGLRKSGAGELEITGANTFTGGVDLAAGRLRIFDNANESSFLGDASNVLTFSGNAEFFNVNNVVTMPQGITINPGVTATLSGAFGERTEMSGVLAGSGTMVVQGYSAGWTFDALNTANTFTGPIEIRSGDAATLRMNSLADSANAIRLQSDNNNGGIFEYASGAISPLVLISRQFELIVNGNAGTITTRQPTIRNNAATANTITINTALLITGTGNKTFFLGGGNAGTNTFAGVIPDAIAGSLLHLYKVDGGKWILTGVNTYEGGTIIQGGTLEIGGAGQLGAGTYAGNIVIGSSFTVNSTANNTFSGVISGAGSLVKDNVGTLTLTNANTYSGNTTVTAGTLSLGDGTNNSNLSVFSTLSVDSGAVLNLNYTIGNPDTVQFLNLGGSPAAAGEWGATGSGAANESALITGTGRINNGDGVLTNIAFWDGGTTDIGSNGNTSSAGGTGTWNTTLLNWDIGVTAHTAWGNTTSDKAIFGGAAGTVTLDADMNIGEMEISPSNGGGSGYFIGDATEDNTLTFGGSNTVTVTAPGTNTNQDTTIRAGITGSPTLNITGRGNNAAFFALEPTDAVTMTLGTLNMFNTNASNKTLVLGGASTGNVANAVTWPVTVNQLFVTKAGTGTWTVNNNLNLNAGRLYVENGTLIVSGTDNFVTHKIGVNSVRGSTFTNSGGTSKLVIGGDLTISDNREWLVIQGGGTLAPGGSVGTLSVDWVRNNGDATRLEFQNGSTYEWEVGASATDVVNLTETGSQNVNLVIGTMTLKVVDAGGTPSSGDQLTVFTYDAGVVTPDTATLNANVTIDITGTSYTGTPSLVNDGAGTIYLTGLSGGGGSPYDTWSGGAAFNADANNDGVKNGLAFLLGAAGPNDNALGLLPTVTQSGGGLVLTFSMLDAASRGGAVLNVEHSSDLGISDAWTTVAVPEADGGPTSGVTFTVSENAMDPDLNDVTATISSSQAAAGKLFGRLKATQ